jgi:hypothetical protein
MTKPKQRVIPYTKGLRPKSMAEYHNEYRLALPDYEPCPACGRAVKRNHEGLLKKHFSDFPNRIHCPEGIGKQCQNTNPGGPRGKYKPRQGPRVVDVDRKSLDTLQRRVVR